MEKDIPITENGKYKNIDVYSLNKDETVTVKKEFVGTRKIDMPPKGDKQGYSFYSAGVLYKDQKVSFIIKKPEEAKEYDACGGVGDSISISLTKDIYTDKKGVDRVKKSLVFVKV